MKIFGEMLENIWGNARLGTEGTVENVMRSPPVTALFSDNIRTVANKMFTNNIGAVVDISVQ